MNFRKSVEVSHSIMKIHNKLWSITLSIYLLFDSLEESQEVEGVTEQEELPFFHEGQQQGVQG